jgi:cytoskeletal protein RodZ
MIKIEITGHSTVELADKMLGLAGSLLAADYRRIYAARQALEAKAEVAEAAPVDPTLNRPTSDASVTSPDTSSDTPRSLAPKSVEPATVTESQPTTTEPSSTPAPAALDFDTDVAPHVLAVVQKLGKPAAQEILSQFGVEKASLLDPARWPELVTALQDAS